MSRPHALLVPNLGNSFLETNPPDLWLRADQQWLGSVGARQFTRANSEVFALGTAVTPGTSDFWISLFFKADSIGAGDYQTLGMATGAGGHGANGFWVYHLAGKIAVRINDSVQASYSIDTLGDWTLVVGEWNHLVINFDRDGIAQAYLNTVAHSDGLSLTGQQATLGSTVKHVGGYATSHTHNGPQCRIAYGTGLITTDDIAELYNYGAGKTYAELSSALQAKVTHYWNGIEASGNLIDAKGTNDGTDTNTVTATAGPLQSFASDSSGNDFHGTLTGFSDTVACWSGDVPSALATGYSLLLNRTTDYVVLPDPGESTSALTVSAWIKSSYSGGDTMVPVGHWETDSDQRSWLMQIDSNSDFRVVLTDDGTFSSGNRIQYLSAQSLRDNEWHHIAFTWDSGTLKLYIDGVEDASPTKTYDDSFTTIHNSTANATIGCNLIATVPGSFWGGNLDEIRIYNSVLSAADIALLASGNDVTATPQAHYTLDDGPQSASPSDGDPVAQWQTRSSGREVFNQGTAANRPLYDAASINSQPALDFDGTGSNLKHPAAILTGTKGTVFAVAKLDTDTATTKTVLGSGDEATTNYYMACCVESTEEMKSIQKDNDTTDSVKGNTALVVNTPSILVWTSTGTKYQFRLDGSDQTESASSGADNGDWFGDTTLRDNTQIGALEYSSLVNLFPGLIAEVIVYDNVDLTAPQIAEIERYLAARYGITLA